MTGPGAREPWRLDARQVAAELGTDIRRGLNSAEAVAHLERYGPNQLEAAPAVPAWRKLIASFADPLIYLLLAALIISLVAWLLEGAEEVRSRPSSS